eukprot:TRINITY_DN3466_c0_g1_i2.p1 TRINITY_DN3466_c0_g1~~TRINITY_DN3466_c0_g1_i2.p1  ORF type:complete len:345 (-),score=32.52 TRINITY_DN3466_c0_g1_i2:813-1847(-)
MSLGGRIYMPRPRLPNNCRTSLRFRPQSRKNYFLKGQQQFQKYHECSCRRSNQLQIYNALFEEKNVRPSEQSDAYIKVGKEWQPVYTTAAQATQEQTKPPQGQEEQYIYETPKSPFGEGYKFLQNKGMISTITTAGLGFLGFTFAIALIRYIVNYNSAKAKKMRQTNRNKYLVLELSKYLPTNREQLSWWKILTIKFNTGFNNVEIYRKYLWYLLRERKFDQTAIDDLQFLSTALRLKGSEVGSAIKERADRIFKQYGTLMLDTGGMTREGVERKAAGRALFSKLLYLTESEQILDAESAKQVDLRNIFGATEDDLSELRIVSLYDVDLDKLDAMVSLDIKEES